ncbi:hypothetical protein D3C81_1571150 [compost metagenome]
MVDPDVKGFFDRVEGRRACGQMVLADQYAIDQQLDRCALGVTCAVIVEIETEFVTARFEWLGPAERHRLQIEKAVSEHRMLFGIEIERPSGTVAAYCRNHSVRLRADIDDSSHTP